MQFAKAGEAWASVLADRKALNAAVKTGSLSEVHDLVFSIRDAIVTLPYKSSGLTPAKKKSLVARVEQIAQLAENLDKYGDANDAKQTKAEYAKFEQALNVIESLYPANALPASGTKPMSASDRALFLTPGGLYTQKDIDANGSTSAYLKYAGVVPNHSAGCF